MQQEKQKRADYITGSDRPGGDGTVGEEQVHAITDDGSGKKTGQDHSTDVSESREPEEGVGAVQDRSDTMSDSARISD